MDKLLDDVKTLNKDTNITEKEIVVSNIMNNQKDSTSSKDFLTNIYLSSQKNNINNQNLASKSEIINSVKEGSNLKTIESAAKNLDLGLDEIKVDNIKSEAVKEQLIKVEDKSSSLDKLVFNRNIIERNIIQQNIQQQNIQQENTNLLSKSLDLQSKSTSDAINKEVIETTVNVNQTLALNIQTRIIGARQQMSTMMSDIARNMYENYKPPVTAFKINLTPGALGAISVIIKNDRDNGLNISMNISNSATLDSFVDNQNSLKSALNKTFNEDVQFNLDFNQEQNNENTSSNQDNDDQEFNNGTKSILESRENNLDIEEKNTDYM